MSRTGWSKPRFPTEMWNQFDNVVNDRQRTTNWNEGFHSRFRKEVSVNASIWEVIRKLINLEAQTRAERDEDRERLTYGQAAVEPRSGRDRRRSQNNAALKNLLEHRSEFSKIDFMKRVSHMKN